MTEYTDRCGPAEYGKKGTALVFSIIIAALTIILYAFWNRYQPLIVLENHGGWDGVEYRAIYNLFKNGTSGAMPLAPFSQRILTPWIASLFHLPPIESFKLTSLLFTTGANAVMAFICYRLAGIKGAIFMLIPPLVYMVAPTRFTNFYPFISDSSVLFFESLIVLAIYLRAYTLILFVLPVAILTKESFWIIGFVPVIWMLTRWMLATEIKLKPTFTQVQKKIMICFAAGSLTALCIKLILPLLFNFIQPYSQLRTVLYWVVDRYSDPTALCRFFAAILLTLAPYLFLSAWNRKLIPARLLIEDDRMSLSFCWMLVHLLFAAFAGSDITRIFFLGYPLYIFLFVRVVRGSGLIPLFLAAISALYFEQLRKMIPEPLSVKPHNDVSGYFSWLPEFGNLDVALNIIVTSTIFFFLFYFGGRFLVVETTDD